MLVSSHLLREMEHTVDHVVIVSRGECVYNGDLDQLRAQQRNRVLVQAGDPQALVNSLQAAGLTVEPLPDGRIAVTGSDSRSVAELALQAGVAVYGIQEEQVDLERLFFQLTSGQYVGAQQPPGGPPGPGSWAPPGGPNPYQQHGGFGGGA